MRVSHELLPRDGLRACTFIVLAAGAAFAGDPEVARTLLESGKKAVGARNYEDGILLLRKALLEDPTLAEAAYWIGNAREKTKDDPGALSSYREFLALLERKGEAVGAEEKRLRAQAERRIDALAVLEKEFQRLEDRLVDDLLAFARERRADDPAAARAAVDRLLGVRPGHQEALGIRGELGPGDGGQGTADADPSALRKIVDRCADELLLLARRGAPRDPATARRAAGRVLLLRPGDRQAEEVLALAAEAAKGPPVDLFSGSDVSRWEPLEPPAWQVLDGAILGEAGPVPDQLRTVDAFRGDFDLRVEARIVEERAGADFILMAVMGYRGETDYLGVGLINRKVYFVERNSESERRILQRVPIAEWKAPFDPTEFAVYELRVRGDTITALINGTVVGEEPRPERRRDGHVALRVQSGKAAFRRVEVRRR